MKTFFKAVWERVVLSYKSTLIGVGAGLGIILLDQFVVSVDGAENPWLKALAALAVVVGSALRSKALPPAMPPAQ
jgi:hypothetical protein